MAPKHAKKHTPRDAPLSHGKKGGGGTGVLKCTSGGRVCWHSARSAHRKGEMGVFCYNWQYSCQNRQYHIPTMLDSLMYHPPPLPPKPPKASNCTPTPPCKSTAAVPKPPAKQRFNAHPVLRQAGACAPHTQQQSIAIASAENHTKTNNMGLQCVAQSRMHHQRHN